MSKIENPKKLLSKKIKIITTRVGNFLRDFFKNTLNPLHYVVF